MGIVFQSSVIFVKDIKTSRRFYEDLLDQKVAFDFGENVSFAGGFAIHEADHISQIMFGRPARDVEHLECENFELYFETDDLDVVLQRVWDAGVAFVHPLLEQPLGQRVFRFYVPDGHIVEIGEPVQAVIRRFLGQGMSEEETARRSSMPLEIVQQVARSTNDSRTNLTKEDI